MHYTQSSLLITYTSISTFLFCALALAFPSGYSYGAALLLLGSIFLLFAKQDNSPINKTDRFIFGVMVIFATSYLVEYLHLGQSLRTMDKPSRFLLAVPVVFFLLRYPPRASYFWAGIVSGAVIAASLAIWQKLFLGYDRATGFTFVIQFGNIAMLFGLICLAGLGWALSQHSRKLWTCILLIGFICGFLASMLSGSRGGWIGLPFVLLVLFKAYSPWLSKKITTLVIVLITMLLGLAYFIPQTGVQNRVFQAFHDISTYKTGATGTSLGTRFELWKGAILMAKESPLIGHGTAGFEEKLTQYRDTGLINPGIISHAHNEYLDALGKRGIIGLVALLALYTIPLRLFLKKEANSNLIHTSYAAAGSVLCVTYMDFGLSQVFLSHNSGAMMFAFLLPIIWSLYRSSTPQQKDCQ